MSATGAAEPGGRDGVSRRDDGATRIDQVTRADPAVGVDQLTPPHRRDGHDPRTRPTPLLPETLADGRYRIVGQLGVGGMGLVVRARDEVLGRDVAVKILADNLSMDASSRARFLHEARAAAAVTDPRVVGVHDVGEEEGRPYLVMELVDGPSLAEVLATEGPLPAETVLRVATDALAGLGCAHDAGLLHRDVKPGNLLRAPDGTIKVTDFGVAIAADADRLTRTGFVIGTAAYLAPERRRGEAATVRTDLWALGATLTELLTGEPPGEAADAIIARLGDHVPPQLRLLLRRLLATEAERRPCDAVEALALLAGDATASFAPTPPPRSRTGLLPADRATPNGHAALGDHTIPGGLAIPGDHTTPGDRATPAHQRVAAVPASASPSRPGRVPKRLRSQLLLLVALALAAGLALDTLTDSGQEGTAPDPGFGPIVVDPADPAGTVQELSEQLRDRAGR